MANADTKDLEKDILRQLTARYRKSRHIGIKRRAREHKCWLSCCSSPSTFYCAPAPGGAWYTFATVHADFDKMEVTLQYRPLMAIIHSKGVHVEKGFDMANPAFPNNFHAFVRSLAVKHLRTQNLASDRSWRRWAREIRDYHDKNRA
jgi:hypothetical protein